MCGICAMCWICVGYVWWIRLKWICVGYVKCAGYVWDMCGVRYANNLLKNPAMKRLSGKRAKKKNRESFALFLPIKTTPWGLPTRMALSFSTCTGARVFAKGLLCQLHPPKALAQRCKHACAAFQNACSALHTRLFSVATPTLVQRHPTLVQRCNPDACAASPNACSAFTLDPPPC